MVLVCCVAAPLGGLALLLVLGRVESRLSAPPVHSASGERGPVPPGDAVAAGEATAPAILEGDGGSTAPDLTVA
jgi:hypothetical protein